MTLDQDDAVIAAPNHHRVALENEIVRVLDTRIAPGETVPLHTHAWPAAHFVLSFSDFVRRDEAGNVTLDTAAKGIRFEPGEAMWSPPIGLHTLENVGSTPLHIVSVEIKARAPSNPESRSPGVHRKTDSSAGA